MTSITKPHGKRITKICENPACKREFSVTPGGAKQRFCSMSCAAKTVKRPPRKLGPKCPGPKRLDKTVKDPQVTISYRNGERRIRLYDVSLSADNREKVREILAKAFRKIYDDPDLTITLTGDPRNEGQAD